jgi:hypothetical protein
MEVILEELARSVWKSALPAVRVPRRSEIPLITWCEYKRMASTS